MCIESMSTIFERPNEDQVKELYRWVLSLDHKKNPFHPGDGGRYWKVNNNDGSLIMLAGVTARIPREPAISDLDEILTGKLSKPLYDDGNGKLTPTLPKVVPRKIDIKDDTRSLLFSVLDEYATRKEYSGLEKISLEEIAKKIIDREVSKEGPPATVELDDKHKLKGNDLTKYRIDGTIDDDDNVFLLPRMAAFSGYYVMLNRNALESGPHTLKFGVNGRYFSYEVVYDITA
jgi:hypothetical protein